jgi:hypothetical protein
MFVPMVTSIKRICFPLVMISMLAFGRDPRGFTFRVG